MCGFVAIHGEPDGALLGSMLSRIRHRGPDGCAVRKIGKTVLGHVRLAIVDVDGGAQPMANEREDLLVAFNGEIYNHLGLRHDIEKRHLFRTRSDTEILLHLYEEKADDMLPMLDGMFAFALAGHKHLLLARDPLGIKPLYYGTIPGKKGDVFLAASEVQAFPEMASIQALPAGHALIAGGQPWRYAPVFPPRESVVEMPLPEILQEIRRRLENAVIKRLMADVPVGVYLSGGLDSSLIAAMMRPHAVNLHSFTAGMAGAPDLEAARRVAELLGTEHHEIIYTSEEMQRALPVVIKHLESFDAPLVRSAIPMYFVSKLASQHVKVVLTGEGADELFAGYEYLNRFRQRNLLRNELANIIIRLQDTNLQRADRMTMVHGIEARVPFLDMDLVRFAARLPAHFITPRADRSEKWLLREACKGLLPPDILQRKKQKFSEGAGSSETMAGVARLRITEDEYEEAKEPAPGLVLRSREELLYYRLWRAAMGPHVSPGLVGRTCDRTAAVAA